MAIKDFIDFSTFTDLGNAFDLFSNSIRRAFTYDAYGDKTKFQAVVLTNPIPVNPDDLKYFVGTGEENVSKKISQFVYRARILGENSPHEFLPNPCDATFAANQVQALKIIEMHTLFVSNVEFGTAETLPKINSVVEVQLEKNTFGYNLQYGKHIKVVFNEDKPSATTPSCDSISSIVANASGASSLGSSLAGSAIIEFANSLPVISESEGYIEGQSLTALTSIVETELSFWSGKVETTPEAYSTLKKYWDNLGVTDWTPSGVPWSAAFISWVVGQADSGFPKSAGHYFYSTAAGNGSGGWTAWSTKSSKIRAQVGDILVESRTGKKATKTSSHGDVVYKISGNKAFLAGGNVGQTAKKVKELSIDSEGNYTNFAQYLVVLKKNGTVKMAIS